MGNNVIYRIVAAPLAWLLSLALWLRLGSEATRADMRETLAEYRAKTRPGSNLSS